MHADTNPHLATAHRAQAPSLALLLLEWRAPWEWGATLASLPLLRMATMCDGHPVLVFPGLAAGDLSTLPMRNFLRSRDVSPYGWEQGLNLGPRPGVFDSAVARVRELADRHGRSVSLVGWSLGGVYARELARQVPECIRCVITLGSPFNGNPRATNAWRLFELASGMKVGDAALQARLVQTPPVPTTSLYSRSDGIVAWQCSLDPIQHERSENIEVVASHVGIGMNAAAWYAMADRLAQPVGAWRPFHRRGWRRVIYPDPLRPV